MQPPVQAMRPDAALPVAVTGATGYIGRALVEALLRSGCTVRALVRRPPPDSPAGVRFFRYATADERLDTATLSGARALVHLAWDTTGADTGAADLRAVQRLADAAAAAGTHFVFVSTQAAARDAPTAYGRDKWQAEQVVLATGGSVVRPGLVYGREERGLFGRLCALVASAPVLPAMWPQPQVQPIHVDDLCAALVAIAAAPPAARRLYCVAAPAPLGFDTLLQSIGSHWLGLHRRAIPAPARLLLAGACVARAIGLPVQPDQLRSLYQLPRMDTADDLQRLGLRLRPLDSGLRMPASRRRRLLVREAATLLHYLDRRPARPAEVRTLARRWSGDRDAAPLLLPRAVLRHPRLLGALAPAARRGDPWAQALQRRLMTACCVAEGSAGGFERFCLGAPVPKRAALLGIAAAVGEEALLRLCAPLLRPPKRRPVPGGAVDGA